MGRRGFLAAGTFLPFPPPAGFARSGAARPGADTPVAVQIPTTTINAYNNWGGASLYGYNSVPAPAPAVSFDRPQQKDGLWPRGYGFADEWGLRIKAFVLWLELAGYRADYITSNDLHEDGALLGMPCWRAPRPSAPPVQPVFTSQQSA